MKLRSTILVTAPHFSCCVRKQYIIHLQRRPYLTCCLGARLLKPQPEHHERLFRLIAGRVRLDPVKVGLGHVQLLGQYDPVFVQPLGDVRQPKIGAVDQLWLAQNKLSVKWFRAFEAKDNPEKNFTDKEILISKI